MPPKTLVSALLTLPDAAARRDFLHAHQEAFTAKASAIVTALEQEADRLRLEDPAQALRAAEIMMQVADHIGNVMARASGLRVKGNLLLYQGRYAESIACYEAAHAIRTQCGEALEIARLQVGWTVALIYLARYDEALALGLATRDVLLAHEKWGWLANLELNIGSVYRQTDQYDAALATYAQCRAHFVQAGNPIGAAQTDVNTARLLLGQDRYQEARALFQQARGVFADHEVWVPLARTDMNLGTLALHTGHYQEAWEHYDQARARFEAMDNAMEVATVDVYRARVYLSLNLLPEALALAQGARPVFADLGMARFVALADLTEALAHRGLGDADAALDHWRSARAFFEAHRAETFVAWIDMEQAALLRASDRPEDALALLDATALVFDRHHLSIRQHQVHLLQAECYRDLARFNRATRLYETVLSAPPDQPLSPALTYRAHYGLGQVAEHQGQREAARQHYHAAVADVEILRRGLWVDEFKASFLDDKLMLYQAAARLSLEMGRVDDAFGYVERAKSSALLDWLARDLEVRAKGDPQVWARLKALKEAWWWHYNKAQEPPLNETARGSADAAQTWNALKHVEAQINHMVRQIQGTAAVSGDDDKEAHVWTKVRDGLEADTVLVEYFCLGDEILAFVLPGDGPLTVCRDFAYSLREVRRSLRALNLSLKGLHGLDPAYVRDVLTPLALRHLAWLDRALLAPLTPWIADCRKLVIVPHDVLYYLPFHAFYDGARYLIERSEVHYAPSAGVLAQCHQLQQRRHLANPEGALVDLVMGYSDGGRLRHIQGEVEAVAAYLPSALRLEEAAATLAQLRQHAGACRLLHLASHAAFRADNPLFSFVQLADAPLNVIDLYHLDLNAALVTLSACETGMSQLKGGDLFGLARGCLHAGAPTLVTSLWQVDDASTARLMDTFYARLAAGATVASALRAAQLALLHTDSPSAHPHYWAPFFLMGADGAPLVVKQ